MKKQAILFLGALAAMSAGAANQVKLLSPDGKIAVEISAADELTYTVTYDGKTVIEPSAVNITLDNGTTIGDNARISGVKHQNVDRTVQSPFYRADEIADKYNEVTFNVAKNWGMEFRAYDDAVAYRFVSKGKKPFCITAEVSDYCFPTDADVIIPYVTGTSTDSFEPQFFNSFENTYTVTKLSGIDRSRLMFLPLVVEPAEGVKVLVTESDLVNYPGMYLSKQTDGNELKAVFAPYPKDVEQGGWNNLQGIVRSHEDYIAKIDGPRTLPWRIAVIAPDDKTLAATNVSYLLGAPSRIADTSWIKPGKVAWEWWNNWNIDGVPFRTGVNNDTYKAYIDFASKKGVEYIILDEGWAVNKKADLMQIVPAIDLKELVEYGRERNVGLILWAGYKAFDRDMENTCKYFSDLGIKGFKVDFMNRDDQQMSEFYSRAAETCARYNLVLDMHGAFKPAGLNRTYPNMLNFEGVHGLENMKWVPDSVDQVEYDVLIPFIRQAAGPMDYTQGAMRNASKGNYFPCNSEPMSQGTRCRQLALYMILDSPLNMMCDSPSNYMREEECADFIASVPTVWDETVVLDGKMGEYIVTARRSGDTWYIGGITDWTPRDIEVDLSFLAPGRSWTADLMTDGANAHRIGRDYKRESVTVDSNGRLKLHLAPGGGFAARIK